MNHDGQVEVMGQTEVAAEPLLLERKRGSIPVAIESGLADRHNPRGGREGDDPVPVAVDRVRDVPRSAAPRGRGDVPAHSAGVRSPAG